jgi:uncharacterized membrane protein YfcA
MELSTILILMGIGLFAGVLSGFVGVGGGIVIVPALIYFLGYSQLQAQGMSLTLMLPPIGVLAFYNYYQKGHIDKMSLTYASIMAVLFIVGGFVGSKLALKIPENIVKLIFGVIMLYVAIRMILSGWSVFSEQND